MSTPIPPVGPADEPLDTSVVGGDVTTLVREVRLMGRLYEQNTKAIASVRRTFEEAREEDKRLYDHRNKRNVILFTVLGVVLLLAIAGVGIGIYLWVQQGHTTDRLSENQRRAQANTTQIRTLVRQQKNLLAQIKCQNDLRADGSVIRSRDIDNLNDILVRAIKGELADPATLKAATDRFQQVIVADKKELAKLGSANSATCG